MTRTFESFLRGRVWKSSRENWRGTVLAGQESVMDKILLLGDDAFMEKSHQIAGNSLKLAKTVVWLSRRPKCDSAPIGRRKFVQKGFLNASSGFSGHKFVVNAGRCERATSQTCRACRGLTNPFLSARHTGRCNPPRTCLPHDGLPRCSTEPCYRWPAI
jgi:hypothetical protein